MSSDNYDEMSKFGLKKKKKKKKSRGNEKKVYYSILLNFRSTLEENKRKDDRT